MYRQTRSDVGAPRFQLWMALLVAGATSIWIGLNHISSPPAVAVGVVTMAVGGAQLRLNGSRPLPSVVEGYVDESFHTVNRRITNPDEMSPYARRLAETADQMDEVEAVLVRPAPRGNGQFVDLQLNGGRVSSALAKKIESGMGTPRMRQPSSEDYYKVFVTFRNV